MSGLNPVLNAIFFGGLFVLILLNVFIAFRSPEIEGKVLLVFVLIAAISISIYLGSRSNEHYEPVFPKRYNLPEKQK